MKILRCGCFYVIFITKIANIAKFKNIRIEVGTSFEAVGEALESGTAHVGFIPGGTYVLYENGADVALTATRFGLNHDSDNPADWNTAPTENTDKKLLKK